MLILRQFGYRGTDLVVIPQPDGSVACIPAWMTAARFEAAHARRQYDAVDPTNRLVAGELERRWNEALQVVRGIEGEIAAVEARKPPLGEREREQLMRLGVDLELAWSHPAAASATRKRIMGAALSEIVVRVEAEHIEIVLHWQGGDHTSLKMKKNGVGKHRWTIPEDTLSLVRELARFMPDRQIARPSIAPASRRGEATAGRKREWARPAATTASRPSSRRMGRTGRNHA